MFSLLSEGNEVRGGTHEMLWHFANARFADWLHDETRLVWCKYSHRGIQRLDAIEYPRKEKRYIFHPQFKVTVDQDFDAVVDACIRVPRMHRNWITATLGEAYKGLHRMGFAHSFEARVDGKLVGGCFGVHIGGYVTIESMFHDFSNASKAAYGQALLILKERGFEFVDVGNVADHHVNYGEEWLPQWKFEQLMRAAMARQVSMTDDRPCPTLPLHIRLALPLSRAVRGVMRRVAWPLQKLRGAKGAKPACDAPAGTPPQDGALTAGRAEAKGVGHRQLSGEAG